MSDIYPPTQKPYSRNVEILEEGVFPEQMHRIALGVEYNGAAFHGFQKQPSGVDTVQQRLETALSKVADESLTLVCAGRTDTGVHGTNQIVHFDTLSCRPSKAWTMGVNALIPDTVSVKWAKEVSPRFHARFSARNRTYRYVIYNGPSRPALGFEQLTWVRHSLDLEAMRQGAAVLIGRHDFSSFRASQCQARSPVREIHYLHIARRGELVVVEIQANAFLHHMVRNIMGVLLAVGKGEQPSEWVSEVLEHRDRRKGGVTAKPNGLHLVAVDYPVSFQLPSASPGPVFFAESLGAFGDEHNR
ncbi:tRNA pseudouridine(38-40) synthase TruA [Pseudomaricurvus alkylphenolicus]|jgi:tRNA pseudouridine38-40 synthase|uniref:tRNA pseudouridine(38-40) synthase TruA n=1 Tax=Pseudomaricurvus alkylphenolicus TaxID=1306991 RepID=UPI0014200690|nr:tRNA pseudouridine(38-40) synthase TruA [Pseudomaricurvus alkylphenolicus]NIB41332.1 tRNA pseudouridine(38-40) synthase TruA [Pseudomaricurvus alkylphenolicus]